MRLVRLQKGERSDGVFRTQEIFGELQSEPKVGASLIMLGKPLNPAAFARLVTTSPIAKIEPIQGGILFETVTGSLYQLDDVKEPENAS